MEMILTRIAKRKGYTIGHLYIKDSSESDNPPSLEGDWGFREATECGFAPHKGEQVPTCDEGRDWGRLFCDTLEPTWRDYEHGAYKIKGKSAIPEGRYAVVISCSPKFKAWLPLLLGGPEFNKNWKGIRIHAGNTAKDTQGCILVGENKEVGKVLNSRKWLYELKHRIVEAKDRGEAVWLTIK